MNGKVGDPDGTGSDEGDVVCVGGHEKGREGRSGAGSGSGARLPAREGGEAKSHDHVSHGDVSLVD